MPYFLHTRKYTMEQDLDQELLKQLKEKLLPMLPADIQEKCQNFDEMFDIYFPNYPDGKLFENNAYISINLIDEKFKIDGMPICKIRLHEKFKELVPRDQLLSLFHSVLQGFQMHMAQVETPQ